jgi:DNA-binding LacI/PurR family transcriptional regulator
LANTRENLKPMNPQQILRVALEAVISEKTVKRWLVNPDSVAFRSRIRLETAAKTLGYPLPQSRAA